MSAARRAGKRLRPGRAALIYGTACSALILGLCGRGWQHVATLNGAEWLPVEGVVRAARSGGEPICFVPDWTRGHAVDQHKFATVEVVSSPEQAWRDRSEPALGLWVVSQFGHFDPRQVPTTLYPNRAHRRLGQAEVHLFRRWAPAALPDSFVFHLHEASAALHSAQGGRTELEWRRTGHQLPQSRLALSRRDDVGCRVGRGRFDRRAHYGIEVRGRPSQILSLRWPRLAVGPWLVVSGGLDDSQPTSESDAAIELRISIDNQVLPTLTFPSRPGWSTRAVPTKVQAEHGAVTVHVATADPTARALLFDAHFAQQAPAEHRDAARRYESPGLRR